MDDETRTAACGSTYGVALIALLTGCGYSAEELSIRAPVEYAIHLEPARVAVGVEPYVEAEDAKAMLGADVTKKFVPVLVVIENKDEEVKLVERAEMSLMADDGTALRPIGWDTMVRRFSHELDDPDAWGPGAASRQYDLTSDRAQDWKRKGFPEDTHLRPGKRLGGIVYFSRPPVPGPYVLRVNLLGLKSQKTEEIAIELPVPAAE